MTADALERLAVRAIERRMKSGVPFQTLHLCLMAEVKDYDRSRPQTATEGFRLVDRIFQRWRRKGWVRCVRRSRNPIWSLTEKGRTELAALHAADHDTSAPSGAPEIAEGTRE